ncbi:MAG: hypothetical protein P8181_03365 [bacterium]
MRFWQSILLFFAAVMLLSVGASAQTDTSLRIRSLGPAFAGILDDFITDAYLNPARVAQLEGPMAYMVTLPTRSLEPPYPVARPRSSMSSWSERDYMSYSIRPIGLSYFGTIGRGTAFSIGAEIDVTGDESLQESNDIDNSGDQFRSRENSYGSVTDFQHYLVDVGVGSGEDGRAFGARLRATYDASSPGVADYWRTAEWDLSIPDRVYINYDANYFQNDYERLSLELTLGLHRPEALMRDLAVTGSVARETLKSDSRVQDGSRRENDGQLLSSDYEGLFYNSDRDYDRFGVEGRAHFGWTERVRSTHVLSWARSTGDGTGKFNYDSEDHGSTSMMSNLSTVYAYDGTVNEVRVESTVGYFNDLFDNVLFAFALFGAYSRLTLDEDAPGDASLRLYDSSLGLDSTLTSPYRQNHARTLDSFRLSVPMAIEWTFHKYAKLRVGVTVTASRVEDDRRSERDALALTDEVDFLGSALDSRDLDVDSGVDAVFLNGLEININDRFVVDLLAAYTYAVNFWEYRYASVRYRF